MSQNIANSSEAGAVIHETIEPEQGISSDSSHAVAMPPEEVPKVDPLAGIIPTQVTPIENQEQLLAIHDSHLRWKESILNPRSQGSVGRACFKGLDLKHLNFSQLDFSYADFSECMAEGVDFSAANLSRALFNKAHLAGANFAASLLKKTSFMRAVLGHADFTGAKAETADFSWATGDYPDQLRHKKPEDHSLDLPNTEATKIATEPSPEIDLAEEEDLELIVDTDSSFDEDLDEAQEPSQLN